MPVTQHGTVSTFQVETNTTTHLLVVQARGANKLSPVGIKAVIGALNTYYGSTLTAGQVAAMPDWVLQVTAAAVTAYAAPGTEQTLATALINAIGGSTANVIPG